MKKLLLLVLLSIFSINILASNPKREFRGAWLHVVGPVQWHPLSPAKQRELITEQFDKLEKAGCNAIVFQIRPAADALYKSEHEPWSKYLTGKRGQAPSEDWDPLDFAIKEAHKRGMELHAWINPYRVTLDPNEVLPADHMSKKYPERFFKYNGQVFFDPAYQENIDFICTVVEDIVSRYDVDAIHMDDYFYPYPKSGMAIPDDASYAKFGKGKDRGDWRRENVNRLVKQLHSTIKEVKPWVRFGVSPFGIWRNKKSDPDGSNTNGLQNYDALYADPLLWAKNGWIDYCAPQLYWALNHNLASTEHLAHWWNEHANGVDIYIGYDVRQSMGTKDYKTGASNEIETKINLSRNLGNIKGNIWWCGYWVSEDMKGVRKLLENKFQSTLALAPVYGDPDKRPSEVKNLQFKRQDGKLLLGWEKSSIGNKQKETDVVKYVVYEFLPGEDPADLENSEAMIVVTPNNFVVLAGPGEEEQLKGNTYVVTAIDRMNRESKPSKLKL